jgi:hypothetical protein
MGTASGLGLAGIAQAGPKDPKPEGDKQKDLLEEVMESLARHQLTSDQWISVPQRTVRRSNRSGGRAGSASPSGGEVDEVGVGRIVLLAEVDQDASSSEVRRPTGTSLPGVAANRNGLAWA